MFAPGKIVKTSLFVADAIEIAPQMLNMHLVRKFNDGTILKLKITEVEIYRGEEDLGCHASKGRTLRTEIMYLPGGRIYVYLIYGIHWLLNITTGESNHPQAILIRGTQEVQGPGRLGKILSLDKSFYGQGLCATNRLWLEWGNQELVNGYQTLPRVGIDYAGEYWANVPWRYLAL